MRVAKELFALYLLYRQALLANFGIMHIVISCDSARPLLLIRPSTSQQAILMRLPSWKAIRKQVNGQEEQQHRIWETIESQYRDTDTDT
jgi:hypothetical protein